MAQMSEQSKGASNKFLIASIFLALLIIGGAVTYAKLSATGPVQFLAEKLEIPEELKSCQGGSLCIMVETRCDFCCDYESINGNFELRYDVLFDRNCALYQGEKCSCTDVSRFPACVNGRCEMKAWPKR
jgi:hypothetical protein